jgi:starch synthase (maltosyl-transferring)
MPLPRKPAARIQIQAVEPQVDCGRWPVKRTAGETLAVSARIFRDGHETLGAAVRYRRPGSARWAEAPLAPQGNDLWTGSFDLDKPGRWSFRIEAWVDRVASFQTELERKVAAGQVDLAGELSEGAILLERPELTVDAALATPAGDRSEKTKSAAFDVSADPPLARFGSWYELFPRSWGGFEGVREQLPRLAELGFDVLYFPPIHPIGVTNRKGRNNAERAEPRDVGSPWAIGAKEGGHDTIHPELGTAAEFRTLVADARELGVEIALDFAIQCSPDHPWLTEHPEWFFRRPDGTLKFAENPPKRYQDIYNVDFDCEDWRGLWQALLDVVLHWVREGVRVFRVDNPHTKPVAFWEWLIAEVQRKRPEVIFLAEAFTRPTPMTTLAKAGFAQSYTYFTWKNTRWELLEFLDQLLDWRAFYRPNFFANTPDILHEYLVTGGRPAFEARLVLAATLSPSYGIYSGFESCENVPVRPGSEEYLNSEKYELRPRALDGPLLPLIARLNAVRRENEALQWLDPLTILETENEELFAFLKRRGDNAVVTVVNLDPQAEQEGACVLPVSTGLPPAYRVRDLLSDAEFTWRIGRNYVKLPPGGAHVLRLGG